MIIFTIKLLKNIRTAIAGRKYPYQLAWAVAFGVLLGIIPHGNLLALATLIVVLSLRINHAMAGLTAVATTFLATKLDPVSDQVGTFVLAHPKLGPLMADAWQLPLVPWTDLNNTVVMGSFLIGVASLIPIFMLTYPLFRLFAPSTQTPDDSPASVAVAQAEPVVLVDQAHDRTAAPRLVEHPAPQKETAPVGVSASTLAESPREASVDQALASLSDQATPDQLETNSTEQTDNRVFVETRIDVIRMKDYRDVTATVDAGVADSDDEVTLRDDVTTTEQPLDEALNYLLRQLRDSQQRKAG